MSGPKRREIRLPDNVTPNWVTERTYDDKLRDVLYGKVGEDSHGHNVIRDGNVEFARTMRGKKLTEK